MKKIVGGLLFAVLCFLMLSTCASAGSGASGLSLMEAIDQSAERISADIGPLADRIAQEAGRHRVAIVAFESESDRLSDFIMSELSGALHDRNIEIVERHGLEWVMRELDFQMSGAVSDETAQSIGQFMGAELIITGQLRHLGGIYRLTANAIRVEQATRASIPRFDVRDDRAMRTMVAAINNQTVRVRAADYGVTVNTAVQSAGAFLDRGIQFAMQGDYAKAITDFTEALRLNPDLVGAYILRGRARVASAAQVSGVEAGFGGLITSTPSQITEQQRQVYDQAIADFTSAIRLDPNNAVAYRERGRAAMNKGDRDAAYADYNQALRLNPNDPRTYNNRGNVHRDRGNLDQALADFNQAIRLDSNYAVAYLNRGIAHRARGNLDQAIADYTQAIRLNPNYVNAYYNRGLVHRQKGDYARAIADWEAVLRLDPNDADARRNLEQDRQRLR